MKYLGLIHAFPLAPNSSCRHVVPHAGHLLATVFRLYSLERWTTLARRIQIVVDVCHLLVMLVRPVVVVLADVSHWVLLAHLIDLMMDLAHRHPALVVVTDAQRR